MSWKPAFLVSVSSFLAVGQVQIEFAPQIGSYRRVVRLPNGNRVFVGSRPSSSYVSLIYQQHSQIALSALGAAPFGGATLGSSGNDIPLDAAVDPSGNLWIVGETDSDDFILVNPVVAQKVPYRVAGFVLELNPTGEKILFATYLGGQQRSHFAYTSVATAIAIDPAGNVYVGGHTDERDFPATPRAFLSNGGGATESDTSYYSFLVKISLTGKLVYSTLLGTGAGDAGCVAGSDCAGKMSTFAHVDALSVDSGGAVTASGGRSHAFGYVFRVSPDGSKLLWTASVGLRGAAEVERLMMVPDANGHLDILGEYRVGSSGPARRQMLGPPGLFAAKLNADGSGLIYITDLGQSADAHAAGSGRTV